MKYTDEYGMGVYPFVPGHGETWPEAATRKTMETAGDGKKPANRPEKPFAADPFPYNYPQNRELALQMITEAVAGELEDADEYARLVRAAAGTEGREILSGIRKDEMKHAQLLRKLYYELTGQAPRTPVPAETVQELPYCRALRKALLGETAAISKYRKILFAMQERRHINMLLEILTDEIRHADLLGLLLHGCRPER